MSQLQSLSADVPANRLLATLPSDVYQHLQPHLKLVSLSVEQSLYEANAPIQQVCFPISAIVSLVATMTDGSTIEVGLVGHEGMVGVPVVMGGTTGTHRSFVQMAGDGYLLPASVLKTEFDAGGSLQKLLLRYVQALLAQTSQSVACNRFHTTEERLGRWLLLVADAVSSNDFFLTQEFIAQMVGVRRAGVTIAAGNLAQAGLIRYSRGRIEIINRPELEEFSCECYGMIRNEFERLLK